MRMYLMVLSVFISFFFLSCGDDAVQPQLNDKERTLVNGNWKGVWQFYRTFSFLAQTVRFGADKQGDMQSCGQSAAFSWSVQDSADATFIKLVFKDLFPQKRDYKVIKLTNDSLLIDDGKINGSGRVLMIHNFSGYQDIQIARTNEVGNVLGTFRLCNNSSGSKAEIPEYGFRLYCAPNPCYNNAYLHFTCEVPTHVKITFDGGPATQQQVLIDALLDVGQHSVGIDPKKWAEGIGKITATVTPTGQSPRTTFLYLGISGSYDNHP
ncbi:MAG: hypothetical protein J0M05_08565 [Candidatus Kapabacteria bacterium]|nr:hypothetical protein [Candidatus Kapabacteria bacterium]